MQRNSRMRRTLPIVGGIGLLLVAITLVIITEPAPVKTKPLAADPAPVTVVTVYAQAFAPTLTVLGTTSARWQAELKARSGAQLHWLDDSLEPGTIVHKDQLLASLDTTVLEAQLAQAKSDVAEAKLQLTRTQLEQAVALKMLRGEQNTAFGRREPQVAAARLALSKARATVTSVEKMLTDTQIRAPYDAVIFQRQVSPAQHVEQGQVLFEIAASDSLDVKLPISDNQWQRLSGELGKAKISLEDRQQQRWPASLRYLAPLANEVTRQREIVLRVDTPYQRIPRLLPNQHVKVHLRLTEQQDAMQLPLSALTRDDEVWTVQEARLVKEHVRRLQHTEASVWVIFNESPSEPRQVVLYPLHSMLPGQVVTPIEAEL
ncbi:efflux RND transporter periplasmic adaptor subunit [Pseudomonas sp. REST10]|uniref:efflux RND transporter periplasmic adaptor subunit n=1 Tax=Pseudomonas sp. REST10 TaxID=2512235 RepID=UPI00240D0391|nr:efflux RND transporter periplasmic adaptor subunit [Pseudomonas sp. REST10]WFC62878.1 efflux RND transporter periplasmic adaptor subunit [Pseudomonas sp. REST10]